LRAEAVILVLSDNSAKRPSGRAPDVPAGSRVLRHGSEFLDDAAVCRLVAQLDEQPGSSPIVFNGNSQMQPIALDTAARNIVAAPLLQCQTRYGWIIGANRIPATGAFDEFGSHEAGLLTMAAGMLASHARNVELFRAEESLRVSVIETITGALDARDPYTCGHSRRVGEFATRLSERCGFTSEQRERIYLTGLLHDVGKIGIPDDILKKPGRLTIEEFGIIQQHPTIGHSILLPLKGLAFALDGVLYHHERVDGRGYPEGLSGEDIPLDARVMAVADSFDAMTSNRAYRQAMTPEQAIEILKQGAGTQWDTHVVDAFLEAQGMHSLGLVCAE
jgi:HD-GYP domain-containing protein (c-di-GMP phosphodiesterase class II)